MKPNKQVEFLERVNKSVLGLEGLQIVVYSDRARSGNLTEAEKKLCTFAELGKKLIEEINGEYIKKKYNISEGVELKQKLHEERVEELIKFLQQPI